MSGFAGRRRDPVEQFEQGERVEADGCFSISAQTPINPPSRTALAGLIGPDVPAPKTSDEPPVFRARR